MRQSADKSQAEAWNTHVDVVLGAVHITTCTLDHIPREHIDGTIFVFWMVGELARVDGPRGRWGTSVVRSLFGGGAVLPAFLSIADDERPTSSLLLDAHRTTPRVAPVIHSVIIECESAWVCIEMNETMCRLQKH